MTLWECQVDWTLSLRSKEPQAARQEKEEAQCQEGEAGTCSPYSSWRGLTASTALRVQPVGFLFACFPGRTALLNTNSSQM